MGLFGRDGPPDRKDAVSQPDVRFQAVEQPLLHLVHLLRQRGPIIEHLRDLVEPCLPFRPDGDPDFVLLIGVFAVPLRLQGLDPEQEHPGLIAFVGGEHDVAGQIVDDGKEPPLLEQETHQFPVVRLQRTLESLQGRVTVQSVPEEFRAIAESLRGSPDKRGAGLLRRRCIGEIDDELPEAQILLPVHTVLQPLC